MGDERSPPPPLISSISMRLAAVAFDKQVATDCPAAVAAAVAACRLANEILSVELPSTKLLLSMEHVER